jgi:hypothetical protein
MYLTELFLAELASSQVFHYTRLYSAIKILKTGVFELSSTFGSIEQNYAPKDHPYFLSTTRTTHGGYHDRVGYSAVMFNLDGNYYNQRYKASPVNYWGQRHNDYGRVSEAEDRIFSREPTMPIGGVQSIHIYVKPMDDKDRKNYGEFDPGEARQLIILAKQRGIPFFLYDNEASWRNQDRRKVKDISQDKSLVKGPARPGNRFDRMRSWLSPWLELATKDSKSQLSKEANKIRYDLIYSYRENVDAGSLNNDFSNARKPGNSDREPAVKLITVMQKNGWKTPKDLALAMYDKWKEIANNEQQPVTEEIVLDTSDRIEILNDFVEFTKRKLHITKPVDIEFSNDTETAQDEHHTGQYSPNKGHISIYVKNRNLVDILRSVCHELVHVKQDQDGKIDREVGMGDPLESEAHAVAGFLIKIYGSQHHEIFE